MSYYYGSNNQHKVHILGNHSYTMEFTTMHGMGKYTIDACIKSNEYDHEAYGIEMIVKYEGNNHNETKFYRWFSRAELEVLQVLLNYEIPSVPVVPKRYVNPEVSE